MRALERYDGCPTGDAVITRGFRLPARYVIHAVGPIWHGGNQHERELLASAYASAFARAAEAGDVKTIAFPAISTGIYGFPKREAAQIALLAMHAHEVEFQKIIACLYDDESAKLYRSLIGMTAM